MLHLFGSVVSLCYRRFALLNRNVGRGSAGFVCGPRTKRGCRFTGGSAETDWFPDTIMIPCNDEAFSPIQSPVFGMILKSIFIIFLA